MATYNGAPYIRDQLKSVAAQTRLPDEIVIGDDRSSDSTMALVKEFSDQTGLTVRVQINADRLGSLRNFEQILTRCKGDIIVLSDQDDIWRSDKLQRIEAAFSESLGASYVFSNGLLIDESGRLIEGSLWDAALFSRREQALYRAGRGTEVLLRHNVVTGAAMAIRREALRVALPIAAGWIHDYWLACVLEASGRGILVDEPLIFYRRHSTQQVGLFTVSLSYLLATVKRHDSSYCAREAAGFDKLADRMTEIGIAKNCIEEVREKARFYERRARMRKRPSSAPLQILRSWWIGDYRRFTPRVSYVLPAVPLDAAASLASLIARWNTERPL